MFPRSFRVLGALVASSILVLSACGDTPEDKAAKAAATTVAEADGSVAASVETLAPVDPAVSAAVEEPAATLPSLPKPKVKIPAELPTKLVITSLKEGTGPAAEVGNIVTVHYVGVRSVDGTEFDNSYDRGQPFPVTLGQGGVIQGWDEGLIGAKAGSQLQLDIPAEMAYGDNPRGDIIKPGDALTFVIDVVSVEKGPEPLPATSPDDAPVITIKAAGNVDKLVTEDLVVGSGDELKSGLAAVHIIAYRADTGEQIDSTWTGPTAIEIDPAGTIPGLGQGLIGMKVGGRRQMTIPFTDAFGEAGNDQMGLPAKTDLVLVVDLIALR